MKQYLFPVGLRPLEASFRPRGDWIVLEVGLSRGQGEQATDIYRMRPDGHGLERVELEKGLNLSPQLSDDGKTILFWRARLTDRPGSRVDFVDMDVWEYDFRTREEVLFAGPFGFRQTSTPKADEFRWNRFPEPVEGLPFFGVSCEKEGQAFDRLRHAVHPHVIALYII